MDKTDYCQSGANSIKKLILIQLYYRKATYTVIVGYESLAYSVLSLFLSAGIIPAENLKTRCYDFGNIFLWEYM